MVFKVFTWGPCTFQGFCELPDSERKVVSGWSGMHFSRERSIAFFKFSKNICDQKVKNFCSKHHHLSPETNPGDFRYPITFFPCIFSSISCLFSSWLSKECFLFFSFSPLFCLPIGFLVFQRHDLEEKIRIERVYWPGLELALEIGGTL